MELSTISFLVFGLIPACNSFVLPGQRNPGERSDTQFCMTENNACRLEVNSDESGNLLHEYDNTNMVGCYERCLLVETCTVWTWWSNTDVCQLFSSCSTDRVTGCIDCQTGPRSCGHVAEHVSAVSGGKGGQDKVIMVDDGGVCNNSQIQMPTPRWGHSSSFILSQLILCGGITDETKGPSNSCDIYHMERNKTWAPGAAMMTPRHRAAGTSLLGKMYMIGGTTGEASSSSTMEVYDPTKDVWTQGPSMPIAVTAACAVSHKDVIIVSGGFNSTGESSEVYAFNVTTNSWQRLESMKQARAKHGCSLSPRPAQDSVADVVVTGGEHKGVSLKSSEVLCVETFKWKSFPDLTYPLESHVQTDQRQPVVLGGMQTGNASTEVLRYANKEWKRATFSLPTCLVGHSVSYFPKYMIRC